MIRENIVAIASTGAQHEVEGKLGELSEREAMVALFKAALDNFLAPTEDEAFMAGTSAIIGLFPDRREVVLAEAKSIGDRAKILNALMSGVPVDMDRAEIAEAPEDAVGLIKLFGEAKTEARSAMWR